MPDEDDIIGIFAHPFNKAFGVNEMTQYWTARNYMYFKTDSSFKNQILAKFKSLAKDSLSSYSDLKGIKDSIWEELLVAYLTRQASHVFRKEAKIDLDYDWKVANYEVLGSDIDIKKFIEQPSIKDGEMIFKKVMTKFMNMLRDYVKKTADIDWKTLRVEEPVNYKGRNRIIAVIEIEL